MVHLLAPAPFGGLETVVTSLCEGLVERGHRVTVAAVVDPATRVEEHPFLRRAAGLSADLRLLRVGGRGYLRERRLVRELLEEVRPGVLHTHGYRPDLLDAPVAARMGIGTVTTVHGFTRGSGKNRVYEWLQRRAFRGFDAVAAVSAPLLEELAASGVPRARLELVPNALPSLPDPLPAAEARARLGIPAEGFHLAWVGRLSHEKGPDLLLEALTRLVGSDWTASVVGDGPLGPPLRERWRSEGREGVRWHGVVDGFSRYLAGVDCLVMSSRTEGTPMVLLEAMASGVPVVATAVGGIPDVARDAAVLVRPEDPAALAAALDDVRRDPERRRNMAEAGLRVVRERFQTAVWLGRYEAIYRRVGRVETPGGPDA